MLARTCLLLALLPPVVPRAAPQTAPEGRMAVSTESDDGEYTYEQRDPTSEEIAAKEKEWKEKNPFKFSAYMPDYSKIKVLVKVPRQKADDPRTKEMEARIALLEQQAAARQAPEPKGAVTRPVAAPAPAKPAGPNPAGVVMRKQSDGRVIAIVGGKSMVFANEQEARAHLARLKP